MRSTRFTRIAKDYDRLNTILSLGRDHAWRKRLITTVSQEAPQQILDLCAGTLECTLEALKRFPHAQVTSVDLDDAMLEIGSRKLTALQREHVTLVHADVLKLDLPPSSFEVILCAWGLRNIEDKDTFLHKVATWLKPHGELLLLDFFRPTTPLSRLAISIGSHIVPLIGKFLTPDGEAYRYLMRSIREGISIPETMQKLEQHGLLLQMSQTLALGSLALMQAKRQDREIP